jgi:citrate lyase subunit beta/citryl-CoA lyase
MTQHTYMSQNTQDTTPALSAVAEATPERNIPAEIARSWLLVNAMKTELFDQSAVSRADSIILDIEDAVDPSQKDVARENIVNWLSGGGRAWVRINDATSPFWADDLAGLRGTPGLLGVMLAKTESADQVTESFHRMDGKTPVIPLVESALGIEEANHIAKAQGAFRLAFGSGDFRRDTGMANTQEAMATRAPSSSWPAGWATCRAPSTDRRWAPTTRSCASRRASR